MTLIDPRPHPSGCRCDLRVTDRIAEELRWHESDDNWGYE